MRPESALSRWLIVISVLCTTVLAQRILVTFPTGDKTPAVVEILPVLLVLLALVVTILARGRNVKAVFQRGPLLVWGPYLCLSFALPVLGVVTGQYPVRTLGALVLPTVAAAALLLGSELSRVDAGSLRSWGMPLLVAAVVQAIYALLQQLLVAQLLPPGPWDWLLSWDVSTQQAYGRSAVIGRSTGFYTNPNILGAWAGATMLMGLMALRGRASYLLVGATFATLVLCQSRGAAVGLAVALAFMLILAIRRGERPRLRSLLPYGGVVVTVMIGWAALALVGTPAAGLVDRTGQGLSIVAGGVDPNVAGRLQFWSAGWELLRHHPIGTLGPPELLLGSSVDSEWVRALLEGGPIFLFALLLALAGGAAFYGADTAGTRAMRAISVFVAVAGITQLPLEYPPAFVYWALVGASMASSRAGSVIGFPGRRRIGALVNPGSGNVHPEGSRT